MTRLNITSKRLLFGGIAVAGSFLLSSLALLGRDSGSLVPSVKADVPPPAASSGGGAAAIEAGESCECGGAGCGESC
ncbi:MAG: hypothetical protein HY471_00150 [Candidatus Sungbacteria bacterium]|nr:hypothetical protein [Candidatus Sungbacteria bacterium]